MGSGKRQTANRMSLKWTREGRKTWARTAENTVHGNGRRQCRPKLKYFNFYRLPATEFSTGCDVVPKQKRKTSPNSTKSRILYTKAIITSIIIITTRIYILKIFYLICHESRVCRRDITAVPSDGLFVFPVPSSRELPSAVCRLPDSV